MENKRSSQKGTWRKKYTETVEQLQTNRRRKRSYANKRSSNQKYLTYQKRRCFGVN